MTISTRPEPTYDRHHANMILGMIIFMFCYLCFVILVANELGIPVFDFTATPNDNNGVNDADTGFVDEESPATFNSTITRCGRRKGPITATELTINFIIVCVAMYLFP
ncbi:hypothetical protein F4821DRAFT_265929 [Hypoxylon rubiginosum]|uniref:Uncharacterized protein n=1 Tax=Hypoxylon rubiginosum TaxID=110542 RepID=A0ACC0CJB0_9PEZI|nr:hypothetical protein F4821DRAFT_265929 [Hypoxylon rubiginosum]